MGDIRLYCLVLLVLSGKTRQLLGRFREFDEHLVADGPLVVPCGIEAQNHWSSSSPVGMWAGCI